MNDRSAIVIGAGVVGVCCALWLVRRGIRTTLVDGNQPGSVTSCGNACTIATYATIPVNDPKLPGQLPKLVFGRNAPLSIDPLYAAQNLGWLISFLRYCRSSEVARINQALAQILAHTHAGIDPLVEFSGMGNLISRRGAIYAYRSEGDYQRDRQSLQVRESHGARFSVLDANDMQDLEPGLKMRFDRAVLFDGVHSVRNPQQLVDGLFQSFLGLGGNWSNQHARAISEGGSGVEVRLQNDAVLSADRAVIAAGAFSRQIVGSGAENLPLDTERGYHVQFSGREHLVSRPVHWVGSGFYASPTTEGLRFAGTVEIAGLKPEKNSGNLRHIDRLARQMFALEGEPDQTWLGFRPTLPDSLPVIGPSPASNNILFAFGHQHIGLTLAGITGKLIAECVCGETPSVDLSPYRADRFG